MYQLRNGAAKYILGVPTRQRGVGGPRGWERLTQMADAARLGGGFCSSQVANRALSVRGQEGLKAMRTLETLFVTRIYRAEIAAGPGKKLVLALDAACRSIAEDDAAGQRWCEEHDYPGYTSYASLTDLASRFPEFADLERELDKHVAHFARDLDFDLGGRKLVIDSLWINVLPESGYHTAHIHPHSVISGTFYVAVPKGAAALKLEDPRLAMMMAAPPRKASARRELASFASIEPKAGTLLLWESWLRHEVPVNRARSERISVSFNYRWE